MRPTGANTRMFAWRLSPISTADPCHSDDEPHCQEFGGPQQESQPICCKRPRSFNEFTFSQPAGLGLLVGAAAATAIIGKRDHGTALGPAPDCLAVPAAPQSLGSRSAADRARGD